MLKNELTPTDDPVSSSLDMTRLVVMRAVELEEMVTDHTVCGITVMVKK